VESARHEKLPIWGQSMLMQASVCFSVLQHTSVYSCRLPRRRRGAFVSNEVFHAISTDWQLVQLPVRIFLVSLAVCALISVYAVQQALSFPRKVREVQPLLVFLKIRGRRWKGVGGGPEPAMR
jgi:hypothetical protein